MQVLDAANHRPRTREPDSKLSNSTIDLADLLPHQWSRLHFIVRRSATGTRDATDESGRTCRCDDPGYDFGTLEEMRDRRYGG
jgi:hypothetical protein